MTDSIHKPFGATLFSRALYTSWCHVPRYELLFDCGEGCALHLGNNTANVRKIFLGHGHGDHVLGLIGFIGARNNAQGMSRNEATRHHNKALEIFYPVGDTSIEQIAEFCAFRNRDWLRYDLKWTPIPVGAKIDIGKNLWVESFETIHHSGLSLGYVIRERRKRLKPEYVGKNIRELLSSGTVTPNFINEEHVVNLFAYCLDAYDFGKNADLTGCEHAVMDCTFINKDDRNTDDPTHFTIDEALTFCHNNDIDNMYAAHVSPRYDGQPVTASFVSEVTTIHKLDTMMPNQI